MTSQHAGEPQPELYVSVDIEAAGPVPGEYSMLALGACLVTSPDENFYAELRPINGRFVPEALKVSGLSMEQLTKDGRAPAEVMISFRSWVVERSGSYRPIFVGFNAAFDWAFVNWYFQVYVGQNPFGIGGIDIKSYAMGLLGCSWQDTALSRLPPELGPLRSLAHNAVDDAIVQGQIFAKMLTKRT